MFATLFIVRQIRGGGRSSQYGWKSRDTQQTIIESSRDFAPTGLAVITVPSFLVSPELFMAMIGPQGIVNLMPGILFPEPKSSASRESFLEVDTTLFVLVSCCEANSEVLREA